MVAIMFAVCTLYAVTHIKLMNDVSRDTGYGVVGISNIQHVLNVKGCGTFTGLRA